MAIIKQKVLKISPASVEVLKNDFWTNTVADDIVSEIVYEIKKDVTHTKAHYENTYRIW